jgi:hypothetical protein
MKRFTHNWTSLYKAGLITAISLTTLASHPAVATSVSVDARAAIFDAGQPIALIGSVLPPSVLLGPGSDHVVTFSDVTGRVDCVVIGSPRFGPDGSNCTGSAGTLISSANGISGIDHDSRQMFLTGVFVGPDTPSDPAPPVLQFAGSGGSSFSDLYPLLNQEFFVGDGLTGTGSGLQQSFHAPSGATRLFLGFADAYGFGTPYNNRIGYPPSSYGDNSGFISANVSVSAVPDANTASLVFAGLVLLGARIYRQRSVA